MTTVAYRDGIIAADTMGSWSGDVSYGVPKLAKTNRFLLGFCGSLPFVHPMYEWILEKGDLPLFDFYKQPPPFDAGDSGVTVLVVPIDGSDLWYFMEDGHGAPLYGKKYEAIGAGGRFAIGAMHAGASAVRAVQAAIDHDELTGGNVVSLSIEDEPCDTFSLDMKPAKG